MKTKTHSKKFDSRTLVAALTLAALMISSSTETAFAQGEIAAPTDLRIAQIAYGGGDSRTLVATWTNSEHYDVVEVSVGGEPAVTVFGSEELVELAGVDLGAQTIEIVARAGDESSDAVSAEFAVLESSPVESPIANLACEFVAAEGGRFVLSWEEGTSSWDLGAATVSTLDDAIFFEGGTTSLEIEGVGLEQNDVVLHFVNAEGYFSEPIVPDCTLRRPTFIRGDCNSDGRVTISDVIFELSHLFRGGVRWYCDDACDVNDDGDTNLSDPISTLNHLFLGTYSGDLSMFRTCVVDETADFLGGICGCPSETP